MRRLLLICTCVQLTAGLEAFAQESHASPLDATWTLAPAFSTMCSAGPVSILVTVGRVYTRRVDSDSLAISSDVAVSGNGMTILATHHLTVRLDSASGAFTFVGPVSGSAQRSGGSGTLAGKLEVRGEGRRTRPDTGVREDQALDAGSRRRWGILGGLHAGAGHDRRDPIERGGVGEVSSRNRIRHVFTAGVGENSQVIGT